MCLHLPLAEQDIKPEKDEFRGKRPRGRPPKISRDSKGFFFDNQKKTKHGRMLLALRDSVYTVKPFGLFQIALPFALDAGFACMCTQTHTLSVRSDVASLCSAPWYPPLGVHQGHLGPPGKEPGSDEMGRPAGGGLQVPQV